MDDQSQDAPVEIRELFLQIMQERHVTCTINWKSLCTENVLRDLGCSPKHVNEILYEHVLNGGAMSWKPNPDPDYENENFGAVVLKQEFFADYYIKFTIEEPDRDPYINVVSAHFSGQ